MDFVYASGRLNVKLADLKKIELQVNGLLGKPKEEILPFLNHLQLAGNSEMADFVALVQGSEKVLAHELISMADEDSYHLLDAVFANEVVTFLNLKLNNVAYQSKFRQYDVIHLSLKNLLAGEKNGRYDFYQKLVHQVQNVIKLPGRSQEAYLTKIFYKALREATNGHLFIDAKETAINLRSLYRAKTLNLSLDEYKEELLGDDNKVDKFINFFRLDDRQIVAQLKEKIDGHAAETYDKITLNPGEIDHVIDLYIEHKMSNLIYSSDYEDLFLLYGFQKKKIIKQIKYIYNQGEKL